MSETVRVDELRAEIARTRQDLGETVEVLASRTDVKKRAKDAARQTVVDTRVRAWQAVGAARVQGRQAVDTARVQGRQVVGTARVQGRQVVGTARVQGRQAALAARDKGRTVAVVARERGAVAANRAAGSLRQRRAVYVGAGAVAVAVAGTAAAVAVWRRHARRPQPVAVRAWRSVAGRLGR